jgi:hypothetical protein
MDGSNKAFNSFLVNLSRNPAARSAYSGDPVGVMNAAGLSNSQITAVLSQDPANIQKELGGEVDAAIRVRVIVTILVEF